MRIHTIGFFLFIQSVTFGQTTSRFQREINSLDSLLRKTNSFKEQIKGEKLENYIQKKMELITYSDTIPAWKRLLYLTELLEQVRDNHIGFYQRVNYSLFSSKKQIDSLFNSDYFRDMPVVNLNMDSLKKEAGAKAAEVPEGIYQYGNYYKMALVKTGEGQYQGIAVESAVPYIKPGQIIAWLKGIGENRFTAVYLHPLTHNLIYYPIERYEHQQLLFSSFYQSYYKGVYKKKLTGTDYVNLPDTAHPFLISEPMPGVRYVRIRSFSNIGSLRKQSDSLHQLVKTTSPLPYTILDLRNNTGGSDGMSKPYIKWIKQIQNKSKVIVLINANTVSQGEITAYQLSKLKGVILAGQQTKGMLAYGSNYGKHIPVAGGEFSFYPTDMRNGGLLQFEDIGITPTLRLSTEQDWLDQIYEYWKLK
jgi:hypothetical protein